MALSPATQLKPHPYFRRRLIGVNEGKLRRPLYIAVTPDGDKTFIMLPPDISALVRVLVWGPSGSGKSITIRDILEELYFEWLYAGERYRHPIFIYDSKANYLGITAPNNFPRDRRLLQTIHNKNAGFGLPSDLLNVYAPAYIAPTYRKEEAQKIVKSHKRWGIKDLWGVPWRQIMDIAHLGTVLKVPSETLWSVELTPTFDKSALDSNITLKDLIRVGGILEKAADKIANPIVKGAAKNFVVRWRKNRYWFQETDKLAQHLNDPFSINVLTFVLSPTKTYFNQLAFLISLQSIISTLQNSTLRTQPVIVIHDVLNFIGEGMPFRNEIMNTLKLLMSGQARSLYHGYIIIVETQDIKALPEPFTIPKEHSIVMKFKWKDDSPALKPLQGFLGGVCSFHDNTQNFHRPTNVVRPPLTSYET